MLMSRSGSARPSLLPCPAVRRISALALFAGASSLALYAQQAGAPAAAHANAQNTVQVADLSFNESLASRAGVSYSSSSNDGAAPATSLDAERLNLAMDPSSALQPPPRRRYGRPRYNDSSHNPDGSNKYTFVVGAGMTAPVGNTYHYLNTNYAFQVGGGRNFNKNFGVLLQFDYDRFGFNGRTLYNQLSLYNYCPPAYAGNCSSLASLDGNTHVWSFSLNPIYQIYSGPGVGAYVVGGVGFYHKVANFTTPETGEGFDYIYGPYTYTANAMIDHYSSQCAGLQRRFWFDLQAVTLCQGTAVCRGRYVFVDNSQRYGVTAQ